MLWLEWIILTAVLFALVMGAHNALDALDYRRRVARRLRDLP